MHGDMRLAETVPKWGRRRKVDRFLPDEAGPSLQTHTMNETFATRATDALEQFGELTAAGIAEALGVGEPYARKELAVIIRENDDVDRERDGRAYVYALDGGQIVPRFELTDYDKKRMRERDDERSNGVMVPVSADELEDDIAGMVRTKDGLTPVQRTAIAYQDGQEDGFKEKHDIDGLEQTEEGRSLNFHTEMMNPENAADCCRVVPGYNRYDGEFVGDMVEMLPEVDPKAKVAFGRESSPVMYVYTERPKDTLEFFGEMESEEAERSNELRAELHDIAEAVKAPDEHLHLSVNSDAGNVYDKVIHNGGTIEEAERAQELVSTFQEEDLSVFEAGSPDEASVTVGATTYPAREGETYQLGDDDVPEEAPEGAVYRGWMD